MRIFTAEIKRLLKTRSVLILMLAALLLAPVLAYFPASFATWTYRDDSGQEVTVKGGMLFLKRRRTRDSSRERSPRRSCWRPSRDGRILPRATRADCPTASTTSG